MLQFNNTKILSFPRFKIIKNEKLKVRNYKGFNLTNLTPELKKISNSLKLMLFQLKVESIYTS